ncbi:MAG: branched-chain amino acid ABC transporter permease [Polyangiaceae bacterium]|nr:branched-chain amino acid ABC transporter permease [Polyangiaceae bacterium]
MADVFLVWGNLCVAFCLMSAVVFFVGRGRIYAVGVMMFYGVGMVSAGEASSRGWPPAAVMLVSALGAATLAVLHAPLLQRLRGDPFILATLLLLEVVRRVSVRLHGHDGLTALPRPAGSLPPTVALVTGVAAVCAIMFLLLSRGEWRRRWQAIGEGLPSLVSSGGVSPLGLSTLAFSIGAAIAGAAGVMSVWLFRSTEPARLTISASISVFAFSFVGGMSLLGALVGAALYVLPDLIVQELFKTASGVDAAQWRTLLIGGVLVAIVLWQPAGLAGNQAPFLPEGRSGDG